VLTVLRAALNRAVRQEVLPRNVAALVDMPAAGRRVVDAYTEDEAKRLLASLDQHELLITTALMTGLRQGEILALRWRDVEGDMVNVSHTLHPGGVLGEPKTESSRRTLKLPPAVMVLLRSHKAAQAAQRLKAGRRWHDLDFVFAKASGQPYAARTIQKAWKEIAAQAGIPHKPFHALRHTFATVLLSRGVEVVVVSKALGHSSISITADVYADWTRPMQETTAEVMSAALAS
jgi:integrase